MTPIVLLAFALAILSFEITCSGQPWSPRHAPTNGFLDILLLRRNEIARLVPRGGRAPHDNAAFRPRRAGV